MTAIDPRGEPSPGGPGPDATLRHGQERREPAGEEGAGDPAGLRPGIHVAQRYELIEMLGKGGMGEVWKARHVLLRGFRAIKVIAPGLSRDAEFRSRFLNEGQVMMRVRHPGIVEVTDLDALRETGQLFMVMEYLEGRTLHDAARDGEEPLGDDTRESARILREVALGMQRIHDERIVHKDLKSDNILLVPGADGLTHSKVIDFGVSKDAGKVDLGELQAHAAAGAEPGAGTTLAGTPAYIAPELFQGRPSTFRSDIYSFGVVAYEVLSRGSYPLAKDSFAEYFRAHRDGTTPLRLPEARPDLDPRLVTIFDRCLSPAPEERPGSFREVAEALQQWLDGPERRRRRNRVLATAGTVAALAAAAVWGVFFSGRTASLGPLEVGSGGRTYAVQADRRLHLPGSALPAVGLAAALEGRKGVPRLVVDGLVRPAEFVEVDGKLRATADLRDLLDGDHAVALQASRDGAPTTLSVVVDRVPPVVRSVQLEGSEDRFTNRQAPVVLVEVDDPPERLESVAAVVGDRTLLAARPRNGSNAWSLPGTAERDGPVAMEIRARDLAGNAGEASFEYVRDTVRPACSIRDLYEDPGETVAQVLRAAGSDLEVTVPAEESAAVSAAIGDAAPEERRAGPGGMVKIALPPLPAGGLPVRLVVRDAARNESSSSFRVRAVEDEAAIRTQEGAHDLAVRGDRPVRLELRRTYAIGRRATVVATRLLDGRGLEAAAGPRVLEAEVSFGSARDRSQQIEIPSGALEPGVYLLEPADLPGVRIAPFRLTVDRDPPELVAVRVRASDGRPALPSGWVDSADVIVEADVRDLSLREVRLGDYRPREPPAPGLRTYTFEVHCEREGSSTLPFALADAADNKLDRTVTVKADWSAPRILSLSGPDPAREYDDVTLVPFSGTCSEAPFTLQVRIPGRPLSTAAEEGAAFQHEFRLPAGDPVQVVLKAIDPAGHGSEELPVSLRVRHLATDLQPEILHSLGVSTLMRKVDPGEIVYSGRGHPVGRVYLDKTEVTNAQYRSFLTAAAASGGHGDWCLPDEPKGWSHEPPAETWGDPTWNADGFPVVNVAWWDAAAFARWTGRRLPTEAEWVKAACKAPGEEELRSWPPFPPGQPWRDGVLATEELVGARKRPLPAGAGEDVSPAGCLHMGGNVSEWVSKGPSGEATVRGGNWFLSRFGADVRSVTTRPCDRSLRAKTVGFRCARDESEARK